MKTMRVRKIRVVIADDHPTIPGKVAELLKETCQVVASVNNGRAAVEAAARQNPDLVLMDISMPIMNGIEATRQLVRTQNKAKVIFLTVHDDPDFLKAALAAGASGYIVKSHMATDLLPAIREALAGHRFISPCLRSEPIH
jgi:DNA-binding NarL/FixJ family response regulator